MVRDIVDIVQELVSQIDNTVKVQRIIAEDESTSELILCSTKWLKVGADIELNGGTFTVQELDPETGRVLLVRPEGVTVNRRDVGTIKAPTFIHGTRVTANVEWLKSIMQNISLGVPLIWLHESIQGTDYPQDSSIEREESLRLFFLDELSDVDAVTNEVLQPVESLHRRKVAVRPMLQLVQGFYESIDARFDVMRRDSNYHRTLTYFGNENQKGVYENILDARLGGVEIRPALIISKGVNCCNK